MSASPDDLSLQRLEEVALIVDLRQTIDDGHPINFFVVLGFGVRARQVLENGGSDFDAIVRTELRLVFDLRFVDVGAVRRALVYGKPQLSAALESNMLAGH